MKTEFIILVVIIAIIIIAGYILRQVHIDKLTKAIEKQDDQAYEKLLLSPLSFLVNHNQIATMKACYYMDKGETDKVIGELRKVNIKTSSPKQVISYFDLATNVAVSLKNADFMEECIEKLESFIKKHPSKEMETMLTSMKLTKNISITFDPKVIEQLQQLIKDNPNDGNYYFLLAKADYIQGNKEEAKANLQAAKKLVKGTEIEKFIASALKDMSILGE